MACDRVSALIAPVADNSQKLAVLTEEEGFIRRRQVAAIAARGLANLDPASSDEEVSELADVVQGIASLRIQPQPLGCCQPSSDQLREGAVSGLLFDERFQALTGCLRRAAIGRKPNPLDRQPEGEAARVLRKRAGDKEDRLQALSSHEDAAAASDSSQALFLPPATKLNKWKG